MACVGLSGPAVGQDFGRIEGRILGADGKGVEGVVVQLEEESGSAVVTDRRGGFALEAVPAGVQNVRFSLGDDSAVLPVEVAAGSTVSVEQNVDWSLGVADTITVFAASRRREKIVEAPAAISTLAESDILREAPTGQVPALFASLPGAELTQSGLYDFKFNARGANISVNRRIAVLIDGRDPAFPLLGSQEWASNSFPLDDLSGAELVRGPSSALYGANAFNGILNLTTKAPRFSQGGLLRLTGGELSTLRAEFRQAGDVSENTFYKVLGSFTESDDFYRSRFGQVEYSVPCMGLQVSDCLFFEAVPLPQDGDEIAYAGARIDRYFENGRTLVAEAGTAELEGYVLSAPGSRFQITDLSRPWARVNFNSPRWNALLSYTGREAEATILSDGSLAFTDSFRGSFEVQGNWDIGDGRGRLVAGLWAAREDIDSADPSGVQTLLPEAKTDDLKAAFAQIDWDVNREFKLVFAARVDDSQFYDPEFSPKLAAVWQVKPGQSLRFGYNSGFLRPNYPEYFVRVPVLPPTTDLAPFEGFCLPAGVSCGFELVPFLAVGNKDLTVENIQSVEVGYKAILGNKGFLTIDGYFTRIEDFVQQFVPQVGTRLGRANPNFGPYAPPPELPEPFSSLLLGTLEAALGTQFPLLTTENGRPLFATHTVVNFGEVETQGIEAAIDYLLADGWALSANYSWLGFDVKDELVEAPLEANGPESKVNLVLSYGGSKLGGALSVRWFDSFRWAEGFLIGDVPSYTVVNLSGGYDVDESWTVGVNINNLLDERHYELFGGDILERRALGYVSFSW